MAKSTVEQTRRPLSYQFFYITRLKDLFFFLDNIFDVFSETAESKTYFFIYNSLASCSNSLLAFFLLAANAVWITWAVATKAVASSCLCTDLN